MSTLKVNPKLKNIRGTCALVCSMALIFPLQGRASANCSGTSAGWPVFNNANNSAHDPYECTTAPASGDLSIGAGKTHTWTSNNPGSGWYWIDSSFTQSDTHSGAMSVTTTGSATLNPYSATCTNWLTPSNTRYWSTGVLWSTAKPISQVLIFSHTDVGLNGSNGQAQYPWSATNEDLWYHQVNSDGQFTLYNYNTSNVNSTPTAMVKVYNPTNQSESGREGFKKPMVVQKSDFSIADLQTTVPASFKGGIVRELNASCPPGYIPMHSEALVLGARDGSKGPVPTANVFSILDSHGARVITSTAMIGVTIKSQLVCRLATRVLEKSGGTVWGTKRKDKINSADADFHVYSGPGNDLVTVSGNGAVALGGLGNDRISVYGSDSVGLGGPGNDVLIATGSNRVRLEGGFGKDVLTGNQGPSFLDAVDGKPGDVVNCVGTQNIALIDHGDIVKGSCSQTFEDVN